MYTKLPNENRLTELHTFLFVNKRLVIFCANETAFTSHHRCECASACALAAYRAKRITGGARDKGCFWEQLVYTSLLWNDRKLWRSRRILSTHCRSNMSANYSEDRRDDDDNSSTERWETVVETTMFIVTKIPITDCSIRQIFCMEGFGAPTD